VATTTAAAGESVWIATGPDQPTYPTLGGDVGADVAVLGAGIVGITTAFLLSEEGAEVVLLDANQVARGVSGHTTAKLSSQHGLIYDRLRSTFGADHACEYGQANQAGLEWIAERVERDEIDCDFRRRSSYAYVTSDSKRSEVEDEARAAVEIGLPATFLDSAPLPYPTAAAVRFDDQAEFHVRKYLLALPDELSEAGCRIYERTRALDVDGSVVKTPGGRVSADRVVVATHYPFLDRSLAFARVHAQRSYALVCRIAGTPPKGMFISGDSPTRSVRAVPVNGEELLLVGGEGHGTGTGGNTEERYQRLERFAREHWEVESVEYRWSSQDNVTSDRLPYVGRLTPWNDRVLMATGFAKWGLAAGTAAALVLDALVRDRDHPWARLFNPSRLTPLASAPTLVKENTKTALRFVGDRVTKRGTRSLEALAPGEGDIVRADGEKVAGYRDDEGRLFAVSTRCTHLGCQVNWNAAERSWDCPCHGSRFAPAGEVLHGPAVQPLEQKRPTTEDAA
jgi:glycine/D-amino acid oxidase-like deaminating enzyme/nitrite reductase/ring-hydroxylating ferredoxin subunit